MDRFDRIAYRLKLRDLRLLDLGAQRGALGRVEARFA